MDWFNASTYRSIFFISKKAGGTGLNISEADRVLILEPCWNPTLDLQAGVRAHRLGQRRIVEIGRLVVENTIEHYVWHTSVSKTQVNSAILENTKEDWHISGNQVGTMETGSRWVITTHLFARTVSRITSVKRGQSKFPEKMKKGIRPLERGYVKLFLSFTTLWAKRRIF